MRMGSGKGAKDPVSQNTSIFGGAKIEIVGYRISDFIFHIWAPPGRKSAENRSQKIPKAFIYQVEGSNYQVMPIKTSK